MPTIRVTGLLWVPVEDYDPSDRTGLTQEAFVKYSAALALESLRFGLPPTVERRLGGAGRSQASEPQLPGQLNIDDMEDGRA